MIKIVVIPDLGGVVWSVWEIQDDKLLRRLGMCITKRAAEALARWFRSELKGR